MMKTELGRLDKYHPHRFFLDRQEATYKDVRLTHYTNQAVKLAVEYSNSLYGDNRHTSPFKVGRDNKLFYHNTALTQGIISRALLLMEAIQDKDSEALSKRDVELTLIAAAFLHANQTFEIKDSQRLINGNESRKASAALSKKYMYLVNGIHPDDPVYTEEDILKVADTITPSLTSPNLASQILQLAAVEEGIDGKYGAKYRALALFAENNLDFRRAADSVLYITNVLPTRRQAVRHAYPLPTSAEGVWYKSRLIGWLSGQKGEIAKRKKEVDTTIRELPVSPRARDGVRLLFDNQNFQESIETMGKLAEEYGKDMDFGVWAGNLMNAVIALPYPYFPKRFVRKE